ncbi:MAG: ribosomal-protein-alanine N-acetyltransferase, partial [Actinobacteria bacterium]|nr:ribosomal-protein-alanine N-acetyltransferase [Actinomycetota bacterium]
MVDEVVVSILDRIVKRHGPQQADKSNPELVIVQMQRRDIREIMPIENAVYPKPWTEKVFQDEIEMMYRNQRLYLVARVGRELVGYCGLLFSNDDAHITNIAVSPRWQNCGVATELMLELAWEARERGFQALTLEVRHTNHVAQELYRRFGFAPAGIRKKYYENTDDAIVMWCQDIQSDAFAERIREIA